MTVTTEPQVLPDAGMCRWCTDLQWDHKRGKGGCKVPGCGCDKYLPPKSPPAPAAGPEQDAAETPTKVAAQAAIVQVLREAGEALDRAVLGGRALVDPVETVDVVRRRQREPEPLPGGEPTPDPAAQAEHARQVAAIDAQLAEDADDVRDARRALTEPGASVPLGDVLAAEVERLTADFAEERTEHQATGALQRALADKVEHLEGELAETRQQRDKALRTVRRVEQERDQLRDANQQLGRAQAEIARLKRDNAALVDERDAARQEAAEPHNRSGQMRAARDNERRRADRLDAALRDVQATNALLRENLDRANLDRQRAHDQLDEAIRAGVSAAANVMRRYDAGQCETCGFRTTVLDLDHEHELTPVTVLIVRRVIDSRADAPADTNPEEN